MILLDKQLRLKYNYLPGVSTMPLLIAPALTTVEINDKETEYAISFVYNFNGDVVKNSNVGGVNFVGSIYNFSALNIPNSPANLPAFRSLMFSQTYSNNSSSSTADFDGILSIFIPQSGQLVKIGSPVVQQNVGGGVAFPTNLIVNGMIPIISNKPTTIQFCKQVSEANVAQIDGILSVTLSTRRYPPYMFGSTLS
jgi:hypothetical protein